MVVGRETDRERRGDHWHVFSGHSAVAVHAVSVWLAPPLSSASRQFERQLTSSNSSVAGEHKRAAKLQGACWGKLVGGSGQRRPKMLSPSTPPLTDLFSFALTFGAEVAI